MRLKCLAMQIGAVSVLRVQIERRNTMYIDPFWCGVLVTIFAEVVAFFITVIHYGRKNKK